MDIVAASTRSRMMAGIKVKNTRPEVVVRTLLHGAGYRYRLHRRDLPGVPDLTLSKHRAVIFVHGCFWHWHEGCRYFKTPASNTEFWIKKLGANKVRDKSQVAALLAMGWRVLVVWECATRNVQGWQALLQRMDQWIRAQDDFCELAELQNEKGDHTAVHKDKPS